MEILLKFLERQNLDWVDLDTKDKNGDTCLNLACLQGYATENELEENSHMVMQNRLKIVKMLISKVDLSKTTHSDMNNPLQWCMFFGDVESGKILFQARPAFLEEQNGVGETLFDMFVSKRVCLFRYAASIELTHFLCRRFCQNLEKFIQGNQLDFEISTKMQKVVRNALTVVERAKESQVSGYIELGKVQTSIFVHKDRRMKSQEASFLHKMLAMCVIFNEKKFIKMLMDSLGINPFVRAINGKNCLHVASERKDPQVLEMLIKREYRFIDTTEVLDLNKLLSLKSKKERKTALHYSSLRNHFDNFSQLRTLNKTCESKLNRRAIRPIECSRNTQFQIQKEEDSKDRNRALMLDQGDALLTEDNHDADIAQQLESGYIYAIITKDHKKEPEDTLVFSQLQRIDQMKQTKVLYEINDIENSVKSSPLSSTIPLIQVSESKSLKCVEYKGKLLKVKWIQLMDFQTNSKVYYRHCFLLGIVPEGMNYLADLLNLQVYHKNKKFPEFFYKENANSFENFRPTHFQTMILFLLKKEFDLDTYIQEGIIEKHFFLHEPSYTKSILDQWWKDNNYLLFDNMKPKKTNLKYLDSLGGINHYLGTESALFLGYSSVYTTWLILLSFVGVITWIVSIIFDAETDNPGLPFLSLLICLMICLAEQFWARRQNELLFLWKTRELALNEKPQRNHMGRLVVDPVYRRKRRKNAWSTTMRRCITEIPIMLIGISLILCNFLLFFYLNKKMAKSLEKGELSHGHAKAFSILFGFLNGLSMFLLNMLYVVIVNKVIKWENHRFSSDERNSLIPKLFMFGFLNYYINLLFYAFYMKDFEILKNNFVSIFVFTVFSSLGYYYFAPIILYWVRRKYTLAKLKLNRINLKKHFLEKVINNTSSTANLSPENLDLLLKFEEDLLLWERVELDLVRPPSPSIMYIWMDQLFQFGFVAFFGISYPLAPLLGLFFNYVSSYLLIYRSFKVSLRPQILKLKDSGIWDFLNTVMSFSALIVNAALFACCSNAFKTLFNAESNDDLFQYLVIYEHTVFLLKLVVSLLIVATPSWLAKEQLHESQKRAFYLSTAKNARLESQIGKKLSLEKEELSEDFLLFGTVQNKSTTKI